MGRILPQVRETTRDVTFLHNEMFFAAAQRKYVYIYDKRGLEVHCLRVGDPFVYNLLSVVRCFASLLLSALTLNRCGCSVQASAILYGKRLVCYVASRLQCC